MKILVIEDNEKTALSIREGLIQNEYLADIALDGNFAIELIAKNSYQLILCDIILPHKNGFEVIKEIRNNNIHTPVIFLTALSNTEEKIQGFEIGADDYVTKPFVFNELLARMKAVLNRYHSKEIIEHNKLIFSEIQLNLDTHEVKRLNTDIDLTPKEFDLLKFFIENNNRIISRSEIAQKVWNINFETGTNTIDVYVNYLRNKIDKKFEKKMIQTVHGLGYIFKDNEN